MSRDHLPLVSVILPSYQRPEFLRAALLSVLGQSVADFEVLVVDDCSEPPLQAVVEELDDPRIRYFRHDANRGEGAARNTAIRHVRGRWVTFLDDDDEWLPDKLELQLDHFASLPARVGCVGGGFVKVSAADAPQDRREEIPTRRGDLTAELMLANVVGPPSTVMLRRECLDRTGVFDERITFGADWDFWIRVSQGYEFDFVPQVVARYTVHPGQISKNPFAVIRGLEVMQRKYGSRLGRGPREEAEIYFLAGRSMSLRGEVRAARRALLRAVRCHPFHARAYVYLALSIAGSRIPARCRDLVAKLRGRNGNGG